MLFICSVLAVAWRDRQVNTAECVYLSVITATIRRSRLLINTLSHAV